MTFHWTPAAFSETSTWKASKSAKNSGPNWRSGIAWRRARLRIVWRAISHSGWHCHGTLESFHWKWEFFLCFHGENFHWVSVTEMQISRNLDLEFSLTAIWLLWAEEKINFTVVLVAQCETERDNGLRWSITARPRWFTTSKFNPWAVYSKCTNSSYSSYLATLATALKSTKLFIKFSKWNRPASECINLNSFQPVIWFCGRYRMVCSQCVRRFFRLRTSASFATGPVDNRLSWFAFCVHTISPDNPAANCSLCEL